ncbi:Carbohydrate-binding protein, partial [Oryctes borbonicus]
MSVMTYDYHGSWEQVTGHVSPLFGSSNEKYPQYNTDYTMNYLVGLGAPRDKLLMGVPFYGQSFKLQNEARYDIGAPSVGPAEAGEYTKQPGMLAYYEICGKIRNKRWIAVKNRSSGPYAYYREQWVGYDNIESAEEKAKYVSLNGYGGVVAWTIDLDDFNNLCCDGTFPLLKAINRGLGRITGSQVSDCSKPPEPVTPIAPTLTTGVDSGASSSSTTPSWEWTTSSETTTKRTTTPWWTTSPTTEKPTTAPWWATTTKKPSTTTTTTTMSTTTSWWKPETTTVTAPPLGGVGVTMPSVDHKPVKCNTGEYLPDPMNCNAYYFCVNGEIKKQYCAGSLHWNKDRGICDWPENAKCTPSKPYQPGDHDHHHHEVPTTRPTTTTAKPIWQTTTTSTTTAKPFWETTTQRQTTIRTTTQQAITAGLEQPCEHGVYYPHEDCHNFYICVNGQLVSQHCGPGLVWNVQQHQCDWKYVTDCGNRFYRHKIKGNLIQRIAYQPYTSCEAGSFAAYEGDCNQYLICLWGKYEAFQCASGLEWNDDKKICDWPENARCSSSDRPPSVGPDTDIDTPLQGTGTTPSPPQWRPPSTQKPKPVTTPRPEVPKEPLPPLSGYFKIVCYFTNWAWYRRGDGKYTPDDIDQDLCTHIVYGFAVLDYENLIIKPHDSWADFDNKFYERVVAHKSKGKKVSLALGGWNDSQGDKYSRLVNNPSARARFVRHAIEFLEKYGFDGLDLDWEYPKCWQVDCKKGPDSDKPAFAALTNELHQAFAPKGLLLSAAVSPSKIVVDAGYDVPTIGRNLDWVAVMTYDFHGQWDKQTGHVAPMYYHPEDEVNYYNSNFSINYWIEQGVPRRKIVMGMPMYGQSFTLENPANHGLNAKAPGPGQAGEFTRAAGFLAYYEICDKIKREGWTVVQDPKRRMGPYAYHGNQWVSYDDKEMIQLKSEYIRKMDLGGGMIWALDLDDFKNRCGDGHHTLLTTIRKELAAPGSGVIEDVPQEVPEEPEIEELPPTLDKPHVPQEIPQSTTVTPLVDKDSQYKVVCYFTNWAWYRQGVGKYLPSNIDPDLCTHIIYGFAVLNGDQGIIKPHDSWADFDNKFYEKVTAFKAKGIKVLIAIGGWNDSAGDKYSKLVNNPATRRRFIAHVVEFIETNNFDGLDLDWEYPKCWQVDCNKGPHSDKPAFAEFVKELHDAFKPKGWLLSSAVSPSKRVIDAGYEVPVLSQYLDWIAVMCYDYHGQWDKVTGHVAPMYAHPEDVDDTFNTNFTIHYWIELGADPKKLVLGMPMYGQSFSLADNNIHGLNSPTYGGGEAGDETRARGFLSYY